jgi:arylsulfatase A
MKSPKLFHPERARRPKTLASHSPVATLLFAAIWLLGACSAFAAPHPNFVVIFADDQGWGTTSVPYDPDVLESKSDFFQTPSIARLAKIGLRFTAGYASHPNCSPSRAALLTGRSPAALKFTDVCNRNDGPLYEGNRLIPARHIDALPAGEVTLPEIVKRHLPSFKAAHFGKWHLGEDGPEAHGFDAGDGPTGNGAGSRPRNLPDDPKLAFSITERGNAWMEQQVKAGTPFYLQISHYATHLKYQSTPETKKKFEQLPAGKRRGQLRKGC